MRKSLRPAAFLAGLALLAAAGSAMAGGGACGDGAAAAGGFECRNMCPLAKKANELRSYGREGGAAARRALAAQVQKGLARV